MSEAKCAATQDVGSKDLFGGPLVAVADKAGEPIGSSPHSADEATERTGGADSLCECATLRRS
ncbi:MAG: hypothetical protein A4E64_01669 [Syntrophorhabdus sp. PtaU1.Bin058]|nr:MAG: hypothetical protein A4E64_01669 [Syntrophorhabdus sp. PtaU1.Bin058]